jgi:LPS sulfotransferase NodH
MFPITYAPKQHETKIVSLFGNERVVPKPGDEDDASPTLLVCFSNRSGSNFICQALTSTGLFGNIEEYLNYSAVSENSEPWGANTFPRYCLKLKRKITPDGRIFGVKVAWHQLYFLIKVGIIPKVYRNPKYLLVRRRDILGQAVSASIAWQTNGWWTSSQNWRAEYSRISIKGQIESAISSYSHFLELFATFDLPYREVVYEDFSCDPERHTQAICKWLGLEPQGPDMQRITIKIQRNLLNDEFRRHFIHDVTSELYSQ